MRLLTFLAFFAFAALTVFLSLYRTSPTLTQNGPTTLAATPTPYPTPTPIDIYSPPRIATASSYTVILVGDSMTDVLGENFDQLRKSLAKHYPEKVFGLFNYGYGSTSILSVEERLNQGTEYLGRTNQAILDRYFDVLIIESMGNNPLSEYPLDQGLKLQTEALNRIVSQVAFYHPSSVIVFLATIAPSQSHFGIGAVDLSPEQRNLWANERRFYTENHINFAKTHHFPLINVYEKSLNKNGSAILKYLNSNDYIHPSGAGIEFISKEIADFLFYNQILLN